MATLTPKQPTVRKALRRPVTNVRDLDSKVTEDDTALELRAMQRAFAVRRQLLAGSIEATPVAELLGITRQAVHEREKKGRLLAVREGGRLHFPLWQFDAQGDDGVVPGLPLILATLDEMAPLPALVKMSWLQKTNSALGGQTPVEALKQGQLALVQSAARGVSAL